jgi:hypothetical protein
MMYRKGQVVVIFNDRLAIVQEDTRHGDDHVKVVFTSIAGLRMPARVQFKDVKLDEKKT